jgi:hypothetical protein
MSEIDLDAELSGEYQGMKAREVLKSVIERNGLSSPQRLTEWIWGSFDSNYYRAVYQVLDQMVRDGVLVDDGESNWYHRGYSIAPE